MSEISNWLREEAEIDDSADCPIAASMLRQAADEIDRLQAIVDRLQKRHAEIVSELYGKGFEVIGWHLNGATEPLDSWFEDNDWIGEAAEKARAS